MTVYRVLLKTQFSSKCITEPTDRRLSCTLARTLGFNEPQDQRVTRWSNIGDFIWSNFGGRRSPYQFYQQHWNVSVIFLWVLIILLNVVLELPYQLNLKMSLMSYLNCCIIHFAFYATKIQQHHLIVGKM